MRTTTLWRRVLAGFGRRALVVILGGLAAIASPRRSEASAFLINLLSDSSGGGGASGPMASGLFNLDTGSATSIPSVNLGTLQFGVLRPAATARLGTEANADGVTGAMGAVRKAIVQVQFENAAGFRASPAASTGIIGVVDSPTSGVDAPAPGIANLNLGNGESLTVSGTVGQSLLTNVSSVPNTNGANEQIYPLSGIQSSSVRSQITNGDGVVASGVVATDIVSYPGDHTGLIPVGVAGSPATEADPVAAPEPGGLLLLASGLAIAGRFLRRRPSRRRPAHATRSGE